MKIKQLCILNSARNPFFFFEKKKYIYNILQLKLPGQIIINVDVAVAFLLLLLLLCSYILKNYSLLLFQIFVFYINNNNNNNISLLAFSNL